MSKINWQKDCKNAMWAMFWLGQPHDPEGEEADKQAIREGVARLVRMTTQKTAGQRGAKNDIDWNCLDHTLLAIACAATSLALSGFFGEMPKEIDEA